MAGLPDSVDTRIAESSAATTTPRSVAEAVGLSNVDDDDDDDDDVAAVQSSGAGGGISETTEAGGSGGNGGSVGTGVGSAGVAASSPTGAEDIDVVAVQSWNRSELILARLALVKGVANTSPSACCSPLAAAAPAVVMASRTKLSSTSSRVASSIGRSGLFIAERRVAMNVTVRVFLFSSSNYPRVVRARAFRFRKRHTEEFGIKRKRQGRGANKRWRVVTFCMRAGKNDCGFFLNLVSTCTRRESDQDKMQSGGRENSVSARARTAIGSANLLVPSCRIANFTYSNSVYPPDLHCYRVLPHRYLAPAKLISPPFQPNTSVYPAQPFTLRHTQN